ncbi:MAG: ABC transporter permease [Chloroflexota bacterium]|nr:ABC transporter permease [Chloroflexota bacterium]
MARDLARQIWQPLRSWEGLLLVVLVVVVLWNSAAVPGYLHPQNQINLLQLSIEKVVVVLAMAFVIIGGEIDLSVASVMGLAAVLVAWLWEQAVPVPAGIAVALLAGALAGLNNGFWVAVVGLPSLAVTLAGLIGYRGLARVLIEDRSIGGFPDWFGALGRQAVLGPFPAPLLLFFALVVLATVLLHYSGFGRYLYAVGSNREAARFSGVRVPRVKLAIFVMTGIVSSLAGVLLAARLGAVRGSTAEGFELDIITIVLFGGVSIFGGKGTMTGVILSILVILNLRNGLALANVTGNTQTGVIGALLILSVLVPNLAAAARSRVARRTAERRARADSGGAAGEVGSVSETISG